MNNTLICYVAGKSGGHIVPALTLASQNAQPALFFTTSTALDAQIMQNNAHIGDWHSLQLDNFPRKNIFAYPKFIGQFLYTCWQSFWQLHTKSPIKIISFGGYISIPVCLMAWIQRIPVELYELNIEPGTAVKLLAPFARTIYIIFPESAQYFKQKTIITQYPIRFNKHIEKSIARTALGLQKNIPTILILGGSQGSTFINNLTQQMLEELMLESPIQVIHQTGAKDIATLQTWYKQRHISALVFAYQKDLDFYYAAADLALTRAGAGTLFELLFFNVPSIIIPLEVATTTHQMANALAMKQRAPKIFTVMQQNAIKKNIHELVALIRRTIFT